MQLILLSGGSGKRLWPLSNNARSKQFFSLLEKEDGSIESMVQRVVRQARASNLTNEITLATNASQLDKALTELTFIEVQCGNPLIDVDVERFEREWK